jgi:hypothetical protein
MFRHHHLRSIVLGLMLFLAGTAFCSCDSYDPDPYDNVPPVVTVEFNYVVPGQINNAIIRTGFKSNGLHPLGYVEKHQLPSSTLLELNYEQAASISVPDTPETFLPLRR